MPTVTVSTDVDVDVDLNDFDDNELIDELEHRGYKCIDVDETPAYIVTAEEIELVLLLLDNDFRNWEHRRLREKLLSM